MLKIKKFVFNPFSENTFVLSNELNNCIIIDPGCYHSHEEKELEEYITLNKLKIVTVGTISDRKDQKNIIKIKMKFFIIITVSKKRVSMIQQQFDHSLFHLEVFPQLNYL